MPAIEIQGRIVGRQKTAKRIDIPAAVLHEEINFQEIRDPVTMAARLAIKQL